MKNKWKSLGICFDLSNAALATRGGPTWMKSHASFPVPLLRKDRLRVYFSSRNESGMSLPAYVDLDRDDPTKVLNLSAEPLLELGKPGMFDDCGVVPDSAVENDGKIYLYYHGWNQVKSAIRYRIAPGLAVSRDGGESFEKYSEGPLFDRNMDEPYFCSNPRVVKDEAGWHMWYVCNHRFVEISGQLEAIHTIKYASSQDGIHWKRENIKCLPEKDDLECIASATVKKDGSTYCMWYSYRSAENFRAGGASSYKMGYAESDDGKNFVRKDEDIEFGPSRGEWDRDMQAYPYVVNVDAHRYMFYNGNGFGRTGFGVARQS